MVVSFGGKEKCLLTELKIKVNQGIGMQECDIGWVTYFSGGLNPTGLRWVFSVT